MISIIEIELIHISSRPTETNARLLDAYHHDIQNKWESMNNDTARFGDIEDRIFDNIEMLDALS